VEIGPHTRALVTGASRGIGRAIAIELAGRGARVGVLGRTLADLETLAEEIGGRGATADVLEADVADARQVEDATERFLAVAGGLDLLVANAGIAWYGPFRDMPLAEGERMTRVNWLGTLYTVHAGLPHMLDRARGHLLVVSSSAGHRSFPWAAVYGATKFAQRGFLEALRHELSGTGVGVTGVYPGQVETHLHDSDRAAGRMPDWVRPSMAISPEQVARAAVRGVERDQPSVYAPRMVQVMGAVHGVSPALADGMLRRILGGTAAPWRRRR
jgi:3-oxoacyl-[acyl-carrier protein] reductase